MMSVVAPKKTRRVTLSPTANGNICVIVCRCTLSIVT